MVRVATESNTPPACCGSMKNAHRPQAFDDRPARSSGGIGEIADSQTGISQQLTHSVSRARDGVAGFVQDAFQIEQQAADHAVPALGEASGRQSNTWRRSLGEAKCSAGRSKPREPRAPMPISRSALSTACCFSLHAMLPAQ